MRLAVRFICLLVLSVLVVSVGASYYQVQREKRTLRKELSKRAEVLAENLDDKLAPLVEADADAELKRTIEREAPRAHALGLAVYADGDQPTVSTASLAGVLSRTPAVVTRAVADDKAYGDFVRFGDLRLHFYALPLHSDLGPIGVLLVAHDAGHIPVAMARTWRDMSLRVLIQVCLIALVTVVMFQRSIMKPVARTAAWMREMRHGRNSGDAPPDAAMFGALAQEASSFAESLAAARASAEQEARLRASADSLWTADRLAACLSSRLEGSRLFVVSNREPYMHTWQGRAIKAMVPASGLVTALEPVLNACDGTWVAHGSGNADRETVDARGCVRVPPENPRYTLRRVWLTADEEAGHYDGFSNEGLWPLCHIAHTRPTFRAGDWEQYKKVNEKFLEALLEEMAEVEHPVVIVQDYHFALLPRLIKQRRPEARVGIFWHIPWPNPEAFGICPWQRELLDGLLGANLVGFHTQFHCDNFLETVNRALESRVEWDRFAVNRNQHMTFVRPFPISVVFDENGKAEHNTFHAHQAELLEELNLEALYVAVGVDRVDYTKGIIERLQGVERFLEKYPQYQGKFTLVQIGAPSRTRLKTYQDLLDQVEAESQRINARFGRGRWRPLVFRAHHHTHAEVKRFYRGADLCLVTSLHDGMNLVAKEYIVSREDNDGVLILSPFTGAARELPDALIVNPYDTEGLADAIFAALEMPGEERRARMRRLRGAVRQQNVYRWAADLIGQLCDTRVERRKPPMRESAAGAGEIVGNELVDQLSHPGAVAVAHHQASA